MRSETMRWYFCHGTNFEEYTPLYDDGKYILVQNDKTGLYSFGLYKDFGTLFGFPVDQSCLSRQELLSLLDAFIGIDAKYNDINKTMHVYESMKVALRA